LIDEGKLEEARVVVQDAITKCRSLVTGKEENPFSSRNGSNNLVLIGLVVGSLIIISLIFVLIIRKPHFNLRKTRKKHSGKGFEF